MKLPKQAQPVMRNADECKQRQMTIREEKGRIFPSFSIDDDCFPPGRCTIYDPRPPFIEI